jgi:hypothetical protein
MPSPLFLKVMDTTLMEYNMMTPSQKQEFTDEARQKIAELSNDPVAYTELTDVTPVPEYKRNKKRSKGDN